VTDGLPLFINKPSTSGTTRHSLLAGSERSYRAILRKAIDHFIHFNILLLRRPSDDSGAAQRRRGRQTIMVAVK